MFGQVPQGRSRDCEPHEPAFPVAHYVRSSVFGGPCAVSPRAPEHKLFFAIPKLNLSGPEENLQPLGATVCRPGRDPILALRVTLAPRLELFGRRSRRYPRKSPPTRTRPLSLCCEPLACN